MRRMGRWGGARVLRAGSAQCGRVDVRAAPDAGIARSMRVRAWTQGSTKPLHRAPLSSGTRLHPTAHCTHCTAPRPVLACMVRRWLSGPSKGSSPVSMKNRVTPQDHTSAFSPPSVASQAAGDVGAWQDWNRGLPAPAHASSRRQAREAARRGRSACMPHVRHAQHFCALCALPALTVPLPECLRRHEGGRAHY